MYIYQVKKNSCLSAYMLIENFYSPGLELVMHKASIILWQTL